MFGNTLHKIETLISFSLQPLLQLQMLQQEMLQQKMDQNLILWKSVSLMSTNMPDL